MSRSTRVAALAMMLAAPLSLCAQQSMARENPSPTVGETPNVGDMAPDFTAPAADSTGARVAPVALHAMRGRVVVLAFYPKDRSGGCTAELTKFRDDYSRMFGNGVTVLPVSVDNMQSHMGWARDMHFPFSLVSDMGGKIASEYGSLMANAPYADRTVFVVGRDGKIVYRERHFRALDQHAYDALAEAVSKAKGT